MKKLKISIIGCGAIGTEICKAIDSLKEVELVCIVDKDKKKINKLLKFLKNSKPKIGDINTAVEKADLIVECAVKEVVYTIATKAIAKGKDIMIMSSGGLVEHLELLDLARKKNSCIYLPSGAVAGLDGLKSAIAGKVDKVTLITRKPLNALIGAPYLSEHNIDLSKIKKEKVVFSGTAREAINGFPANVNVSVALSLAGLGLDKTYVKIIADPNIKINIHEIEIEGEFGKIKTKTENVQSPINPRTSFLAALSAVATFKRIIDPVKIGT